MDPYSWTRILIWFRYCFTKLKRNYYINTIIFKISAPVVGNRFLLGHIVIFTYILKISWSLHMITIQMFYHYRKRYSLLRPTFYVHKNGPILLRPIFSYFHNGTHIVLTHIFPIFKNGAIFFYRFIHTGWTHIIKMGPKSPIWPKKLPMPRREK